MFSAFERLVAVRYLRARRQEGFISVIAWFSLLGIFLGVGTLIVVMSVMNGFRQELLSRLLGLNGHITVYAAIGDADQFAALAGELGQVAGVVQTYPVINGQAMLLSADQAASGALVRGVRPEDLALRPMLAGGIVTGSLADFVPGSIVTGSRLAAKLGVGAGMRIALVSPTRNSTAFGMMPRVKDFTVAATFNVDMYEYDSGLVFMHIDDAQAFFRVGAYTTETELLVERPDQVAPVADQVRARLGPAAQVGTWQERFGAFFNALVVERNVMFLILTLIILVAAFNIISSMIMMVKTKGRDIAILRTMGATRGAVMRIFFLSGASIGLVGTTLGVIGGLLFCNYIQDIQAWLEGLLDTKLFSPEVRFLSQLPAIVDSAEVVQIAVMSLLLTLLATIYPSWRAARLDPVEALRYE